MARLIALFLATCSVAAAASAQALPSEPVTFGGGRAVMSGDVAVSAGSDDPGFFNYSDYERSTLRTVRLGLSGAVRLSARVSILGELRSENFDGVWPAALYARISPFPGRRLDVQVGRIPPAFGGLSRRTYGRDNPLIGAPLAYQYLTSLRPDALPADLDELIAMRGRGWLASYSVGNPAPARGVPLVSAFTWDTGVQITTGWRAMEATAAVTTGTLSNPRVSDDNSGKQLTGRVTMAPATGLVLGTSFARGGFVSRRAAAASGLMDQGGHTQTAYGVDAEYSRGHLVTRADAVFSAWRIPLAATRHVQTLRAAAVSLEARVTFLPGAYAAARAEHLTFGQVSTGAETLPWDAPVTRLEVGAGYYLQRNLVARASIQFNERHGRRDTGARLAAAQLLFWF